MRPIFKKFGRDQRGIGFVYIVILMTLFIMTFIWILISEPLGMIIGLYEESPTFGEQGEMTINILKTAWAWWPIFLLGCVLLYGILHAIRREYEIGFR